MMMFPKQQNWSICVHSDPVDTIYCAINDGEYGFDKSKCQRVDIDFLLSESNYEFKFPFVSLFLSAIIPLNSQPEVSIEPKVRQL